MDYLDQARFDMEYLLEPQYLSLMNDFEKAKVLVGLEVNEDWLVKKARVISLGEGDWDIQIECERDGEEKEFFYYMDSIFLTIE